MTWKPAVDANRIALGGQIVGLVAVLVAGRLLNTRLAGERSKRLQVPDVPRRLAAAVRTATVVGTAAVMRTAAAARRR